MSSERMELNNTGVAGADAKISASGVRTPLNRAQKGSYTVAKVSGMDETKKHLHDLGFTEGSEVKVHSELGGNIIVEVKSVKLALGVDLAKRVTVIS